VRLTYNADCYLSVCRHTGREWDCCPESGCQCLGKGYTGYKCEFMSLAKTDFLCYGMVFLIKIQGVVHIIDRILDASAQIFEADLPKISQTFIPGSCSNMALSYC
jgi:hypothetical protein